VEYTGGLGNAGAAQAVAAELSAAKEVVEQVRALYGTRDTKEEPAAGTERP